MTKRLFKKGDIVSPTDPEAKERFLADGSPKIEVIMDQDDGSRYVAVECMCEVCVKDGSKPFFTEADTIELLKPIDTVH